MSIQQPQSAKCCSLSLSLSMNKLEKKQDRNQIIIKLNWISEQSFLFLVFIKNGSFCCCCIIIFPLMIKKTKQKKIPFAFYPGVCFIYLFIYLFKTTKIGFFFVSLSPFNLNATCSAFRLTPHLSRICFLNRKCVWLTWFKTRPPPPHPPPPMGQISSMNSFVLFLFIFFLILIGWKGGRVLNYALLLVGIILFSYNLKERGTWNVLIILSLNMFYSNIILLFNLINQLINHFTN